MGVEDRGTVMNVTYVRLKAALDAVPVKNLGMLYFTTTIRRVSEKSSANS